MSAYQVIEELNRVNFIARVNTEIARGWRPLGGVSIGHDGYVQAIIFDSKATAEGSDKMEKKA